MSACACAMRFWTSWLRRRRESTRVPAACRSGSTGCRHGHLQNSCLVNRYKPIRLAVMRRIFALLLLMTSALAHADIGGYRVEVIVFQNLLANVDAVEVDSLRSYSNVPELTESNLPDDLTVLLDKSQRMEGVWHRLRTSKGYRPLVYSSWVQNNIDYYPPFRIHDEVVLESQIRAPTNIVVADLQAQDPLHAFRSTFYRLDGNVQLRLSRFLHINLDLEYRVPAKNPKRTAATAFSPQAPGGNAVKGEYGPGNNAVHNQAASSEITAGSVTPGAARRGVQDLAEYDVYRLKQSRQIKTDRLQYFDSPWFGALILVIPIAAESPQPQVQTANNNQ